MENTELTKLLDEFISYLEVERALKDNTLYGYGSDAKKFVSLFGAEITELDEADVKGYLNSLAENGKSASGIARATASLRALYKFLYEKGKKANDISPNIKYNKTERKTPEILTSSEISSLFSSIPASGFKGMRDKAMLELMYATGLRATEIISLRKNNVNLRKNTVTCTSGSKKRTIPLYAEAADSLRAYMINYGQLLRTSHYLFVNTKGTQMTRQGLWKIIGEYAKKAGIKKKISPNILRNSFAAHLLQNGADLQSVQEMMGHLNMTATLAYSKLEKTRISRVYKSAHPRAMR